VALDDCSGFDPLDPSLAEPDERTGGLTERFWTILGQVQARCPVAHSDAHGGLWILTRHDDVVRAGQDWETFSSAGGAAPVPFDDGGLGFRLVPLETDPPLHRGIRKLLNPFFLPAAVAALEDETRAIAVELIDALQACGACEFMSQYAVALPAHVLFRTLLGLGVDTIGDALHWVDRLVMEPEAAMEVLMELMPWCYSHLEARKAVRRDDVLDAVVHGLVDGERPLDEFEQVEVLVLLIIGGLETTANALGNIGLHLATDPELRDRLAGMTGARLTRACDEFLRYEAPAPGMGRTVGRDVEVAGRQLRAGERVILYYGAANRDPEVWKEPDRLVLDREDANRHLAFGTGPHHCLGSHLARLELRVGVEELLRRLPDLRLDPSHQLTWRTAFSRGPAKLPLVFSPGGSAR
jgi:cytochrome P450